MSKQVFERFDGRELTGDMLSEAVELFNHNYGIWGDDPTQLEVHPRKGISPASVTSSITNEELGSRVKLTKNRLRAQYLPDDASCTYVRVKVNDHLAGNAFACRWSNGNRVVCWVTQLVVHNNFRERGLAAALLTYLRQNDDAIYGLMSSHPAACLAAAKAFGSKQYTKEPQII